MSKNKQTEEPIEKKVVTRYDRKMQEREQRAKKEKRENVISKVIAIAVAVVLVAVIAVSIGISVNNRSKALSKTYVKIGDHELTGLEYDFYFNNMVTSYLTTYSAFLPYMGLDTSKDYADQAYDDTMTWKDAFDQMTVEQIRQSKALADDAAATGFVYETEEEDYASFQEGFKSRADQAGVSVADYYKKMFGDYATEAKIEPFVKETLLVSAYSNKLMEDNKPTDAEIRETYTSDKKSYDKVDYMLYTFAADVTEDTSDEDAAKAMEALAERAQIMTNACRTGEDFQTLADQYDAEKAETADTTEDADTEDTASSNLIEQASYSAVSSVYADWLFDESRAEGDTEYFEDADNHKYYVIQFVGRQMDENAFSTISDQLASQKVNDYTQKLMQNYPVTDVAGELVYLTLPEETDESTDQAAQDQTGDGTEVSSVEESTENTTEE